MKINLTPEKKFELEKQHKTERDGRIKDRLKAVLLSSESWPQNQIAQVLRVHEMTISSHLNDYIQEEKLKPCNGGSSGKLTSTQVDGLILHLEQNTYPSTKEIIKYIEAKYSISYTQQGMHDWLKQHKFTFKHLKGVPAKLNEEKQLAFIEKYNELKVNLGSDELILFTDSMHPTQETKITKGWIRTGVEKMIATVASRRRINITGCLELNNMSIITKEYDKINGSSTVDFFKHLETCYPEAKKLHIISDSGSAYTCHEVRLFLGKKDAVYKDHFQNHYGFNLPAEKHKLTKSNLEKLKIILSKEPELFKDNTVVNKPELTVFELLATLAEVEPHPKIELHNLPAYSPNLNPLERGWKVMNEKVRNNKSFATFAEFKNEVTNFFTETWYSILPELYLRINDNFQKLKPVT